MRTTKMRSRLSLLFIALAAMIAIPAVMAIASELTTAELDGTANTVSVTQGTTANFNLKLSATGAHDCTITSDSPSTAEAHTSYSIADNGTKSSGTFSTAKNFFSDGVPQGAGGNCGVTWTDAPTPYSVPASVTVGANTPTGDYTYALSTAAGTTKVTNPSVSGAKLSDGTATSLKITVVAPTEPVNQAPTAPGTPSLTGSNPNNTGVFSLSWTASTDTADSVNDSVTYTLQHKDTDDLDWGNVATGLTSNSYSFADSSAEAEGTWVYRVVASDGKASSAASGPSNPAMVVDKSAPSAPNASTNPAAPDYSDWFKDSVTVSYSGSTDPDLLDTSLGSGVASYTDAQLFDTSGTHDYSGTATDNAGNVSDATTGQVKVDASNPTFGSCTGGPFTQGSGSQSVAITANDAHSGLDSAGSTLSGTVNTSTIGDKTVTFTAKDNVGHAVTKDCTYSVIFNWSGYFQPVDNNGVFNVVKGGSSVPLKFSLSGNQGMSIIAAGYPKSISIPCDSTAQLDALETVGTAGSSGLNYDATTDQYNYLWKTDKSWTSGCRQLELKLIDGTSHRANFKFSK